MPEMPSAEHLRHQVEDIQELATLPHIMVRIIEVVADDTASATDLAGEIASDPSLTAKLLKIVNSAFYGFYREISQLSDAVVILGFEEVKRISLAISVVGLLDREGAASRHKFWSHCLRTAAVAQLLERDLRLGTLGAFTAGLLHDIGRVVLDQHFPEIHEAIRERETETGLAPAQVESELLGVDHGAIGAWVAERWNLPVELVDAIHHHHHPGEASDGALLAALVHIADVVAHETTQEQDHQVARAFDPIALENLNISHAQVDDMRDELVRLTQAGEPPAADLLLAP